MKLQLTAPAVAKLVELDPEGSVELAKAAAAQVAQKIANRMTRDAVTQRIDAFVANDLQEGDWYRRHIASKYQKMLGETMQAMAKGFIDSLTSGEIKAIISAQVDVVWADRMASVEKMLNDRAEQILRERFSAMFSERNT